jgi:hypothetical protein
MEQERKYTEIGSLWYKVMRTGGQSYYSGKLRLPDGQEVRVTVLPNKFKQSTADARKPDFLVYTSEVVEASEPEATEHPF